MNAKTLKKSQFNVMVCFLVDFYIDISAHDSNKYYKKDQPELDKLIIKLDVQSNNSKFSISDKDYELISKYLTSFYNECTLGNSIHLYDDEQMKEFNKLAKLFL